MATAILVAGLGFGDEGKGTTVDYLCAKLDAQLVVRYNGGAQAAHNVVTPDGRHHTFAQLGSGLFHGAHTYLSKYMLVDPRALDVEIKAFSKFGIYPPDFLHVDGKATVITPYHRAANRIWETLRDGERHGSCGVGVGEARSDELDGLSINFGERHQRQTLEKLAAIQDKKLAELSMQEGWEKRCREEDLLLLRADPRDILKSYSSPESYRIHTVDEDYLRKTMRTGITVFEGAQGVLLDEDYGFYPYNSWTNTTFQNADALMKEIGFCGLVERCGVLRTYMTRHGAGPFPTEAMLSVPVVPGEAPKKEHNELGPWQGNFRTGHLDLAALEYAVSVCGGVDYLSVTHLDCTPQYLVSKYKDLSLVPTKRTPESMELLTKELFKAETVKAPFDLRTIEYRLNAPARITSYGPTCRDKRCTTTQR